MQRIVVLNPKGGSGKTTIAVNLAGYYASQQQRPVLMDYDPQGSSGRWVSRRDPARPKVHLISAHERDSRVTRSFQLRPPPDATHIILDTPAAVTGQTMVELTRLSDKILVPVLPSDIDIHACSRCIRDLLLVAKIRRHDNRLGVIANRVKVNTLVYQSLLRFLETLGIPIVATLRDSQNYIRAVESGSGIHEMKGHHIYDDTKAWEPLIAWLENKAAPQRTAAPDVTPLAGNS
ncbi:MAG TPA: ParA family protein [Steroidobacteraceae bacterium]|nr:ParA family protein [Steroidobacteraceae bacterium]